MDNLGKVLHLDHVIPLSSFNLHDKEERREAMNWVNHQPVEASKNIEKLNKVDQWLLVCQEIKAQHFLKTIL